MTHFDAATAAVEAAMAAGARYADARVMHRRTESMSARNGEIEELDQAEDAGIGVRALVGSGWGFFAVPDLSDRGRPRGRRRRRPRSPRPARRSSGRGVDLVPADAGRRLLGVGLRDRPAVGARCPTRATCSSRVTGEMHRAGGDQSTGLYQIWDTRKWFVSSEGHRIDQHIRECGGGISATVIGDGETQRRSYPSLPRASTAPAAGS